MIYEQSDNFFHALFQKTQSGTILWLPILNPHTMSITNPMVDTITAAIVNNYVNDTWLLDTEKSYYIENKNYYLFFTTFVVSSTEKQMIFAIFNNRYIQIEDIPVYYSEDDTVFTEQQTLELLHKYIQENVESQDEQLEMPTALYEFFDKILEPNSDS